MPVHSGSITGIIIPMTDLLELRRRIDERCEKLGLSEREMLISAGLNPSRLKPMKRGEGPPKIDALISIAKVLGLPLAHLTEPAGIDIPASSAIVLPIKGEKATAAPIQPDLDPRVAKIMHWLNTVLMDGQEAYPTALDAAIDLVGAIKAARDAAAKAHRLKLRKNESES